MKSFLYYVIFYLKYALAGLNSGSFIRNLSDGIENLPYINNYWSPTFLFLYSLTKCSQKETKRSKTSYRNQ